MQHDHWLVRSPASLAQMGAHTQSRGSVRQVMKRGRRAGQQLAWIARQNLFDRILMSRDILYSLTRCSVARPER